MSKADETSKSVRMVVTWALSIAEQMSASIESSGVSGEWNADWWSGEGLKTQGKEEYEWKQGAPAFLKEKTEFLQSNISFDTLI